MKVRAIFFALTTLASALLAGCATSTATIQLPRLPTWRAPLDPSPVTHAQIYAEVARHSLTGVPILTSDATFTRINHDFALALIAWTRAFLAAENATPTGIHWVPESFDCDKFAKALTLAIELAASRAGVRAQPLAVRIQVAQLEPFGGIPALPPEDPGHALVTLATDAGLLVVEPQTGAHTPLATYPNRRRIYRISIGG